jgi:mono/diheme cytochrome c family protein
VRQCCCASTSRGEYVPNRLLIAIPALCLLAAALAQRRPLARSNPIAAGEYIVEQVAHCGTCHTPRLANGHFREDKKLMGAPVVSLHRRKGRWADNAPRIAGLARWEDEEVITLLTTGKLETGIPMRQPMPQFHMSKQDATAVVAYLRSLGTGKRSSGKSPGPHSMASAGSARTHAGQPEPGPK